jgi:hypothetical protein
MTSSPPFRIVNGRELLILIAISLDAARGAFASSPPLRRECK